MRGKFGRICKGKKRGRHKKIEITYKDKIIHLVVEIIHIRSIKMNLCCKYNKIIDTILMRDYNICYGLKNLHSQ